MKGQGSQVGEPRAVGHGDTESCGGGAPPDVGGGAVPEKPHGIHWGTFCSPQGREINPEVRKREEPEVVAGTLNVTGFKPELTDTLHYWTEPTYK